MIDVGPGGRELRYTVPDYFNGKLRIVAIAVSPQRVGVAEGGDRSEGQLHPHAQRARHGGARRRIHRSASASSTTRRRQGPIRVERRSAELSPDGPASVDLQIADKKEGAAEFRFKANAMLGAASLKFIARRGRAESHIEESVSVRPPVAYRTQLTLGRFERRADRAADARSLSANIATWTLPSPSLPLVWGQGLIAYLDAYPYPCTEQLVSKGMAALLLASRPEFGAVEDHRRASDGEHLLHAAEPRER